MAIFDIEKDELLRFSDTQLEELIARLAEAEIAAHGYSPAYVHWSGSINAPDGGIDVHVQVPVEKINTVHIPADHEHQFRFNVNTISGPM